MIGGPVAFVNIGISNFCESDSERFTISNGDSDSLSNIEFYSEFDDSGTESVGGASCHVMEVEQGGHHLAWWIILLIVIAVLSGVALLIDRAFGCEGASSDAVWTDNVIYTTGLQNNKRYH